MVRFEDIDVTELIPQRAPFVLVDKLCDYRETSVTSKFWIDQDHLLVEDGCLSAYGLIENMAQTAALLSGYEAYARQMKPKTGFIGSVSKAAIHFLPPVNTTLETSIIRTTQIMNVIVIEGQCRIGDRVCADCTMKIVLID